MQFSESAPRSWGIINIMLVRSLTLLGCLSVFLGCGRQKEEPLPPIVDALKAEIPGLTLRYSERRNRSKALQISQSLVTSSAQFEQVVQVTRTWLQSISDEPVLDRVLTTSSHELKSYSVSQRDSAKVFGDEIAIDIYKADPSHDVTTISVDSYFLKDKAK